MCGAVSLSTVCDFDSLLFIKPPECTKHKADAGLWCIPSIAVLLTQEFRRAERCRFKSQKVSIVETEQAAVFCLWKCGVAQCSAAPSGHSSPRFLRCTASCFPCTADMAKESHVPLAAVIRPFAAVPDDEVGHSFLMAF